MMPQLPWQELEEAAKEAVNKAYHEGEPKYESRYASAGNAELFICYLLHAVVRLGEENE